MRQLSLTIDLGGEQIQIERVEAVEALSRPFVITVDLISTLGELNLYPHLGNPAAITVREEDGEIARYFHGILVEGEYQSERSEGRHVYRLILRPWTHLLSQNRDYAIFQDKTTIDIVTEVLGHYDLGHINFEKLKTTSRKREYCVQYGESDFAFASRLLEEDGYYYYFDHNESRHELVLCDSPLSHEAGKVDRIGYNPGTGSISMSGAAVGSDKKRFMERWTERVATGAELKVSMRDFDFENPQLPVDADAGANSEHTHDELEVYEWPGRYVAKDDGNNLSRIVLDSRRANRLTYSGQSQVASLACGFTFTLEAHPFDRLDQGYLITRTHHVLSSEQYESGTAGGGGHYVYLEAVPDSVHWRAPQITPRPVVRGPETAIVTGNYDPEENEVYTDEYGRVKVRFHWDRSETESAKRTCWIRVSQTGGLGNIILPRVGHEVIVDFLDGNPDRPIVVGRVFNADNMPVYDLDEEKTKATWRSRTFGREPYDDKSLMDIGVGNPGANELRFDDKYGEEEVYILAQKNMNTRIRDSETHYLGQNQEIKVGGNRKVEIKQDDSCDVTSSITINSGTDITVEAKSSITLKVGTNSIVIDTQGVTVDAGQIMVKGEATVDVKSPMTTVNGDGTLTLKGGMTFIN